MRQFSGSRRTRCLHSSNARRKNCHSYTKGLRAGQLGRVLRRFGNGVWKRAASVLPEQRCGSQISRSAPDAVAADVPSSKHHTRPNHSSLCSHGRDSDPHRPNRNHGRAGRSGPPPCSQKSQPRHQPGQLSAPDPGEHAMSNPMALAAVTATLQFWLSNQLNDPSSPLGSVTVTAKAPDLAEASQGKGNNSELIVNLFLHQITPNGAWRNIDLPTLSKDGSTRLTNQPLALDLHYLLTAYGSQDTEAEALLGYSVLMLHETPILARGQIRTALGAVPNTNPYATVLKNSGLPDQFEMIKITPATLGREEMAWLWTALKADYRPTFPFQVSVVLIQPEVPTTFPLPVLSRNVQVDPGLGPSLFQIDTSGNPSIPAPNATVKVNGTFLTGITQI